MGPNALEALKTAKELLTAIRNLTQEVRELRADLHAQRERELV